MGATTGVRAAQRRRFARTYLPLSTRARDSAILPRLRGRGVTNRVGKLTTPSPRSTADGGRSARPLIELARPTAAGVRASPVGHSLCDPTCTIPGRVTSAGCESLTVLSPRVPCRDRVPVYVLYDEPL